MGLKKILERLHLGRNLYIPRRRFLQTCVQNYESEKSSGDIQKKRKAKTGGKPIYAYITSEQAADNIVKNLPENISTVFEVFPGEGVLTKKLLLTNVQKLKVFEKPKLLKPSLKKIQAENPDRMQLFGMDLMQINRMNYHERAHRQIEKIFEGMEPKNWMDDSPVAVVGPLNGVSDTSFLGALTLMICARSSLFKFGRVNFLLYISQKALKKITSQSPEIVSEYKAISIFYHLFFDVQFLNKEPKEFFSKSLLKNANVRNYDYDHFYLVRIVPKKNLEIQLDENKMMEFHHFVRQLFFSSTVSVVNKIESFLPNTGYRLIKSNYSMFQKIGHLSPAEVVNLFKEFSSWPEYEAYSKSLNTGVNTSNV